MTDTLSQPDRSKRMSLIRGKNTKAELLVRRLVHGLGYRYRLHDRKLPGKPDIVFKRRKKVIFVHGCFWHQHPDPRCKIAHLPKTNTDFWKEKLARNQHRDTKNVALLLSLGWEVLEIWECQLSNMNSLQEKLHAFLDGAPNSSPS